MWLRRSFLALPVICAPQTPPRFTAGTTLVLASATVTDRNGRLVRGIEPDRFLLLDDGVRRRVEVEEETRAISLILAAHASFEGRKPLDRLRKAVSLFGPLVIGAGGEAGLVAFRDTVDAVVPLTANFDSVANAVRNLEAKREGCAMVDAVEQSARMLNAGPRDRRKVIVIVTEDRDRSSKAELPATLALLQEQNITVYPLTYSPALMHFGREVPTAP